MRLVGLAAVALLAGCGGGGARQARQARPMPVADGIPLGALPRQALAKGECGLFLWMTGPSARLVLMAKSTTPPFARIVLDGRTIDLPRIGDGPAGDAQARYGDGRVTAAIDVTIEQRRGLADGAVVRAGSIRIERGGGDSFAVPVAGLFACG